jgi:hypothetical protein
MIYWSIIPNADAEDLVQTGLEARAWLRPVEMDSFS